MLQIKRTIFNTPAAIKYIWILYFMVIKAMGMKRYLDNIFKWEKQNHDR